MSSSTRERPRRENIGAGTRVVDKQSGVRRIRPALRRRHRLRPRNGVARENARDGGRWCIARGRRRLKDEEEDDEDESTQIRLRRVACGGSGA